MKPLRDQKNFCFVDLETSGLAPGPAVILSVGAITNKGNEYSALITPTDVEWGRATLQALEVNGLTLAELQTKGKKLSKVAIEFAAWLSENDIVDGKGVFVGQNPAFDMRFLEYFMAEEFFFFNITRKEPIDIRDLYSRAVELGFVTPAGPRRDGDTISLSLGFTPEPKPHTALAGARVVQRCFEKLTKLLSNRKILVR